jgi:3-oxoadipate enol-lactonase
MPLLRTPQVDLNYSDQGAADGPVLVLSNSLGAALEMWAPQVESFQHYFRLIRYDTRGHGESSVPPAPYSIADLGADVLRLLDALEVERAHFCGLSLGGTTGMWLGAHAADRIERLVLCNTAPYFGPPEVFDARIETVRREGVAAIVEGILQRWFTAEFMTTQPDVVAAIRTTLLATPVEGYAGCCAALRDLDERGHLAKIRAATLVIGGTFDPAPTIDAARNLAAAIPGAEFAELPAAHLSNLGAAAQFTARVLEFLNAPW